MGDYEPKTWGDGSMFRAEDATAMSQELEEQEQKDIQQDQQIASRQPGDPKLSGFAAIVATMTGNAQRIASYTAASDTWASIDTTSIGRTIMGAANAAAVLSAIGAAPRLTGNNVVYRTNGSGATVAEALTSSPTAWAVVQRDGNSTFEVGAPTAASHPVRKTDAENIVNAMANTILDPRFTSSSIWAELGGSGVISTDLAPRRTLKFTAAGVTLGTHLSRHVDGTLTGLWCAPGDVIQFSGRFRLPNAVASGRAYVYVRCYDSTGVNANAFANSTQMNLSAMTPGTDYVLKGRGVVPAGYDQVSLWVQCDNSPTSGAVIHLDQPMLRNTGSPAALWVGVPSSATAAGVAGTMACDANYLYVCVAANTWKRTALAAW